MQNKLKAFVRYDGEGRIIPYSLRWAKTKPKNGDWEEIASSQCCTTTTSTTLAP